MVLERCGFETERLRAEAWQLARPADLAARVATVLTPATTAFLPPDWHGAYTEERAARWIAERDTESPTLLVTDRNSAETVGLVILFKEPHPAEPALIEPHAPDPAASPAASPLVDVRLGYVLAEAASELVAGIVAWCRSEPAIAAIAGGVELGNVASARVRLKNGFALVESPEAGAPGEELYRLGLR